MASKQVVIDAYNPYEGKFPNRTVISREELHLIKVLRENGVDYKIRSKYSEKLYILSQKNFESLLVDPIFLTLYSISMSVAANYVFQAISAKKELANKLFIKNKDGEVFDYQGEPLAQQTIKHISDKMLQSKSEFAESTLLKSPYLHLPHPVYLEHTPKIVGWCNTTVDDQGLKVDPMKITCDETWQRIEKNDLKGLSIGGLISASRCDICGENYNDCNHITGKEYSGVICSCEIQGIDLAEISVVSNPANNLCEIDITK